MSGGSPPVAPLWGPTRGPQYIARTAGCGIIIPVIHNYMQCVYVFVCVCVCVCVCDIVCMCACVCVFQCPNHSSTR